MKNYCNPLLQKLFCLALVLASPFITRAQVPNTAAGYFFSAYPGTYTPITGGTPASIIDDDLNHLGIPIGFNFPFAGGVYSTVSACSNGWLSLANANPSAAVGRGNSTGNATTIGPILMPLWDDLNGQPLGQAFYKTTGSAPNRVFTFEWRSWKWIWTGNGNDVLSFQAKLYESGRIEFIYSQGPDPVNTTASATIGIAKNGSDYQTINLPTATPVSSSTSFTTSIIDKPATGQVYSWDAPVLNNAAAFAIPEPFADICIGNHVVKAVVKNNGGNTINNVRVNWAVNGVIQQYVTYNTPIPVGGSATVTLGSTTFVSAVTPVNIQAWTSLPNGVQDGKPSDDSTFITRKALDPPNAVVYYATKRICPGDSLLLQSGTGTGYTYQWQLDADPIPGATQSTYYAKKDGHYSVMVTNPGCALQSAFHKITVKAPQVELGPDKVLCETIPATTLDAQEEDCRYLWSTGDTTQVINAAEGTNKYWVKVMLGSCTSSDTVNLQIDPLPDIQGISASNNGNLYYFAPAGPLHVNNYLWDFGDGSTDTNMYVTHTYSIPGPYEVTLTVYNNCGETKTKLPLPLNVNDLNVKEHVTLYPNPAQNSLTISTTEKAAIRNIRIFNTLGAVVYSKGVSNQKIYTADISNLPNGTYTIVINTAAGNTNKLFQVSR